MKHQKQETAVNLFPHVLIRIGGEPYSALQLLNAPQTAEISRQLFACQSQLTFVKDRLSQSLYNLAGSYPKSKERVSLINLRRDIFNERQIMTDKMSISALTSLPKACVTDMTKYQQLRQQIANLKKMGEALYTEETAQARAGLQKLTAQETLQKGLLLSSQSLLRYGIPRYLASGGDALSRPEQKAERSLLQYVTRIHAKTSPFSTFTHLSIAAMAADTTTGAQHGSNTVDATQAPVPAVSHIRLNNLLYQYLTALLCHNPDFYHWFRLRPNPTLHVHNDCYLFLTNNYNIEAFQRIPINPVLAQFLELVSRQPAGVFYKNIVGSMLANEQIETTAGEIEAYMNQLIAYGFLEFNLSVSGTNPDWDVHLCQQLATLPETTPLLSEVIETLKMMQHLARRYSLADASGRQVILRTTYEQFKDICRQLHRAAHLPIEEYQSFEQDPGKPLAAAADAEPEETAVFERRATTRFYFQPEKMFYEDTTVPWPLPLDGAAFQEIVAPLQQLFQLLRPITGQRDELDKMRHYFCHHYGWNEEVSLLTFYEDYYRDFKTEEAAIKTRWQESGYEDAPDIPKWLQGVGLASRLKQNQSWLQQVAATALAGPGRLELKLAHMHAASQDERRPLDPDHPSYAIFVQLFCAANGSATAVLNNAFPGYGKFLSRFLHLFDEQATAETRCWNQKLDEAAILAEITDASYFNANIHPPLLPYEIWIPGSHNSLPPERQIPVTELQVQLANRGQKLQLIHQPSQRQVYPFDLGFQSLQGRSQLFQLLAQFSPVDYPAYHLLLNTLNDHWLATSQTDPYVQVRPRVVYEERIVLQRQAWLVARQGLPLKQPEENSWAYFNRINQWRQALDMPDELFVTVVNRANLFNGNRQHVAEIGRDHYKPQYLNFNSPLLVDLFSNLLTRVPQTLCIEEMLPDGQQLTELYGHSYVTEFVIQWYTN